MFDFGKDDSGLLYICLEFLEGCNLLELIEREGPPPCPRTVDLMGQTLAALGRARNLGIFRSIVVESLEAICLKASGYQGRVALHELLVVDDEVRDAVAHKAPVEAARQAGMRGGMTTLAQDGIAKCLAGGTDFAQVLAVRPR